MKLKEGFVLHDVGKEHMMVAVEDAAESFNGLVRNNDTADFVYKMLLKDTTEEKIVDAMFAEYDAPREILAADVHRLIEQMRKAGFLDE